MIYCLRECHHLQLDPLLGGQYMSTFTFVPHKFPNSPVKSREGFFASLFLLPVDQQATVAANRTFHSSALTFLSSFVRSGEQLLAPPQLAPFLRASMLLGCITQGQDTLRDQPCWCTQAEHRCLQSSMSLAWTNVFPHDHIALVAMEEFQGTLWSKAQMLGMMLGTSPAMGNWVSELICLCLSLV